MGLDQILQALIGALGFLGALYGFLFFKGVREQQKRNVINEIDLSAKKISLDVHSKPIDDLVSESNKSHGADAVVKDSRDDDPKK